MRRTVWFHVRRVHNDCRGGFDLSRLPVSPEILMAGALGLIIIVSLAVTFSGLFGGGGTSNGTSEIYFICEKCKHEFAVEPKDIQPEEMEEMGYMPFITLDCPNCGGKKTALQAIKCPNPECGKLYIGDSVRYAEEAMMGKEIRDVCPYCGTDLLEWKRKEWEAKKKK